jgi:signal transduction histidine kinase
MGLRVIFMGLIVLGAVSLAHRALSRFRRLRPPAESRRRPGLRLLRPDEPERSILRVIPQDGAWSYDQLVTRPTALPAQEQVLPQGLPARVARLPRELLARIAALPARRQEQLQDLGLGVALAGVNAVSLLTYRDRLHPLWLALVLVVAQAIPLIWRRSGPVGTGLVIAAARVTYDRIGFGFAPLPLGPAIAFYTIFDRSRPVWRWAACALVAAALTLSLSTPDHSEPYEAIYQVLIFLTAGGAGLLSRAKRASLQAAQGRAQRAEAELDLQTSRAAAAERTRIARELHDVVAHHVSLMAVQAEAATSLLPGRVDQARRSVEIIGETARQALAELRRLLGVLRGPSERLETSPSASLQQIGDVLDQVRGAGLSVDLEVEGTPFPLAPGVDLTAYRIIQEALTNTVRHARATRAVVTLRYDPGFIIVSVTDPGPRRDGLPGAGNGAAASPGPLVAGAGLGLAGIAERVASCGGSLTVGPTQTGGFAVTARLPSQ